MKREIFALTITASLFFPGLQASAQAQESLDILDACPKNVVLLNEDDNIRFIQLKIKSGQKCGMHKSPGGFAYVISGASLNIIKPDGTKTATVLKGRLLNSIVSTNLESPMVVEIHPDQGLPEGSILSCLGMTKLKRVVSGCSRLITPGSTGEEFDVEVSLLNTDGTAGITGEYFSGKELYVAGMIASSFARGSIELSQSRLATTAGELKVNSAKNRYLEGILNSADEGADLMKKEMQTHAEALN